MPIISLLETFKDLLQLAQLYQLKAVKQKAELITKNITHNASLKAPKPIEMPTSIPDELSQARLWAYNTLKNRK